MRKLVTDGGDDNQDRIPFAEQTKISGHAVRANYLTGNTITQAASGTHPLYGVIEFTDTVESSRNSGKWRIDLGLVNGAGGTFDATHENNFGNLTIANSGAITV